MVDVKKNLNECYMMLSTLNVSGNAVDVMAAVRQKLREAMGALEETGEDHGE